MSSLKERIERKIRKILGKESNDTETIFNNINFILSYEFKWDFDTIMNTPIPFILDIINKYKKVKEEERKSLRR